MNFSFVDPWDLYLPREGGHVVGFSGSGGKTSLMRACAERLAAGGVSVLMTCTTRSEPLAGISDFSWPGDGPATEDGGPFFLHAGLDDKGKWQGLPPETVDGLALHFPDHVVLVETDGAAKKPLKFYRADEPVWPARTSLAVVVMGIGQVGEPAGRVVHRFAAERLPGAQDLHPDKPWLWDHQLALLTAPDGYLARAPEGAPVVLALGGLSSQEDSIGLFEFVGRAMSEAEVPLVTFFETAGDAPSFRTACLEPGADGP